MEPGEGQMGNVGLHRRPHNHAQMLITNTPICPRCRECVMTRQLSWIEFAGIAVFLILFFPIAIWIYLTPRALYCQNCGNVLSTRPKSKS